MEMGEAVSIYAHGERAEQMTEYVSLLGDRSNNQDRTVAISDDKRLLLIVADGMGGHSDGALAAQCVVDCALELFPSLPDAPAVQILQRIALQSHQNIAKLSPELPDRHQPRTTIIGAVVEANKALFAHSGDSRGYHIRDGKVLHRTLDHSAVGMMVRRGDISEEEAKLHPMRNQVSRCLGGKGKPTPLELTPCPPLTAGDSLLLCSDGFWEPLQNEEICASKSLQELAEAAVSRKPERADNCTALRFNFHDL